MSEPEQADMERLQDKIEAILREWTDTAYALMRAGYSEKFSEYERGVIEGAKQMRWLHLAEPWHPAAKIIAAIHEEASRALADAWEAGRLAQERYEKGCMDQVYSLCSEEVPPLPRNPHKDGDA